MTLKNSHILGQKVKLQTASRRLIGRKSFSDSGPTLICYGGIHGNEPAGVKALERVFESLEKQTNPHGRGSFIGIRGNLSALAESSRFLNHDLNRIWTAPHMEQIVQKPESERSSEEKELVVLLQLLKEILAQGTPPFYFIDLHTTSSETLPFLTINDAVINRKFASLFPVPVILGIEEYLEGPLLSHINELGYVSLGFESGQHQDPAAVDNAEDFLWCTLIFSGILSREDHPGYRQSLVRLREAAKGDHHFYEVVYRHALEDANQFKMASGFRSFQRLPKGTLLAEHSQEPVHTTRKGILFMPLYQKQGEEGFFLIRRIPSWALRLSAWLRRYNLQNSLASLPGVGWANPEKSRLMVNLRITRFFSKQLFHLLGYRSKQKDRTHLLLSNRERAAKNEHYEHTFWYRRTNPEP
jgi:succinylglutamate desuccinylase